MVFVRGPEHSNIQHFVEKVVFHLHESFPRPKRVRSKFSELPIIAILTIAICSVDIYDVKAVAYYFMKANLATEAFKNVQIKGIWVGESQLHMVLMGITLTSDQGEAAQAT
ncbi:protein ENL-like protein [Cricetulus griseus]|nr:protein ENL-like protein [Cricetulus griseus]